MAAEEAAAVVTTAATTASAAWAADEDEVAEEELRLLESMTAVSTSMQQFNQVLSRLNKQTVDLSKELATAERQLNALYLPFQAAIYEMQTSASERRRTHEAQRTEL